MTKTINLLREFSIPLLVGVVVAVLWANLDPAGYHHAMDAPLIGGLSLHFLVNELFMVLFFGIAAVEITQSCLPGGDLNPIHKAVNPLLGTMGGVLGPITVYLSLNHLIGAPELARGWGIPTATDIALAWLAARMVFGAKHPAVSFLLLLAVADDAIGLAIIAIFYPSPTAPVVPIWLLLTLAGILLAAFLRLKKVKNYWGYLLVGGIPSWCGLFMAHLHPALALVVIVPFMPSASREQGHLFEDDPQEQSTLTTFEHQWKGFVDFGLFMFSLANAGVEFSSVGSVTVLVLVALLLGKTIGIFSFSMIGSLIGFPLPADMSPRDLITAGMIAGTGFTVALFVAGEAFTDPLITGAAKMGAMMSLSAAVCGLLLGVVLRIKKQC